MAEVRILPPALDDLRRLDKGVARRILDKVAWMAGHAAEFVPIPLVGPLAGFHKLRVGDWRVIYDLDRERTIITVHRIGHRREIYL